MKFKDSKVAEIWGEEYRKNELRVVLAVGFNLNLRYRFDIYTYKIPLKVVLIANLHLP